MRITKVYTKQGDDGRTQLVSGKRVWKDSYRIEAYGTVDELNSLIGVCRSFCDDTEVDALLKRIQNDLFVVGADLATPSSLKDALRLSQERISWLEQTIDELNPKLAPLKDFVLPSGSKLASFLHLARTVCRRAERRVVSLMKCEDANPNVLVYLNRLSDLLFVLARYVNLKQGIEEELVDWHGK